MQHQLQRHMTAVHLTAIITSWWSVVGRQDRGIGEGTCVYRVSNRHEGAIMYKESSGS